MADREPALIAKNILMLRCCRAAQPAAISRHLIRRAIDVTYAVMLISFALITRVYGAAALILRYALRYAARYGDMMPRTRDAPHAEITVVSCLRVMPHKAGCFADAVLFRYGVCAACH